MNGAAAFNPSYVGLRHDIIRLVPEKTGRVLDVGCATGELGAFLRDERGAEAWGIESDPVMADVARPRLDGLWVADLNAGSLADLAGDARFDCIIFADVLEHLIDPWRILREAAALLCPDGRIIASLPNVGHWSTLWSLAMRGEWPYRDRGIHDRTHLRFFTRRNLLDLFGQAGLTIEAERRNARLCEAGDRWWSFIDPLLDLRPWRRLFVFQYLFILRRE